MEPKRYSYQVYPGQTIVRLSQDGYTLDELLVELHNNGDGVVLYDDRHDGDDDPPAELAPYVGQLCHFVWVEP